MPERVRYAVVAGLICMGCARSPSRAEVSGTVQLNGRPIEEGAIQFIPIGGTIGPSAGEAIRNGKYHIAGDKGVTVGKNRVELRAFRTTGRKVQDATGKPGVLTAERVLAFPPEYNDESTLVRDIQAGSNVIDFDIHIQSKGK